MILEKEEDEKAIASLRDKLQKLLQEKIPGLVINGDLANRLAGNLHISILGILNTAKYLDINKPYYVKKS